MVKYNSNLESNKFDPSRYINFLKEPNNRRFHDLDCLLWSKLFNTDKRLNEIVKDLVVDYSYNENDEANRVLIYRSDPSGEYKDIRIFISKMISDKFEILKKNNLNEFQIFEIFKASKFKYLTSISKFIKDPKAKRYAESESEIASIKEPSLSGDDHPVLAHNDPSLSGDDNPAYNPDLEPRLTDEIPIHERRTVETPKNVTSDVEKTKGLTRRSVLKGLGFLGILAATGKALHDTKPNPTPVPEQTPNPSPTPVPEQMPDPILELETRDNEDIDQAPESLNRDQLKEQLRQLTLRYSQLPNKQTYDLIAESEDNLLFQEAIKLIKKLNLSAQEFIDLKLIRKENLRKFKDDSTRLQAIFDISMSDSDNWIISTMKNMYNSNPEDMAERFKDGALYEAMETVSEELKNESIQGYSDTLDEHPFLKDILYDSKFIEAVLMIEGGLRGEHFSKIAKTEITRSIINSGQFNPNFGSIVRGNLRIGINHILTYYFIRGGKEAPGAVINNQYARNYFDNHGILVKDGYDYRLEKCKEFTRENRRNPELNAPTETKVAQILTDPEESIRIMLMSYRENLHYMKDALIKNLDRLNEYAEIIDNFWIKIIALTNICGGPLTKKLIKDLGKLPASRENYFQVLNKRNKRDERIYHPDYAEKVDTILSSIQINPPVGTQLNLDEAQASNHEQDLDS